MDISQSRLPSLPVPSLHFLTTLNLLPCVPLGTWSSTLRARFCLLWHRPFSSLCCPQHGERPCRTLWVLPSMSSFFFLRLPRPLRSALFRSVPLRSTPLRSDLLCSALLHSDPLRSDPLRSAPIRSVPLRSAPPSPTPLLSTPLTPSTCYPYSLLVPRSFTLWVSGSTALLSYMIPPIPPLCCSISWCILVYSYAWILA